MARWTWRGCFLLTGIVTIYPLIVGWLLVPSDLPVSKFRAVDWFGAFSVGIALFLLLLTLTISQTSRFGWQTKCERCLAPRFIPLTPLSRLARTPCRLRFVLCRLWYQTASAIPSRHNIRKHQASSINTGIFDLLEA